MSSVSEADEAAPQSGTAGHRSTLPSLSFLISFATLSVAVPAALLSNVEDVGRSTGWLLATGVAMWSGLRLSMLIAEGRARFFAYFFWLFTYLFMGIAPVVQIRSNQPSATTPDVLASRDLTTLGAVILGVICFEVGSLLARSRRRSADLTTSVPRKPSNSSDRDRASIRPIATMFLALFGLAVAVYYLASVGVDALLTSREAATEAGARLWPDLPVRALVNSMAVYPLLIAVGGLIQLRAVERVFLKRLGYLIMIAIGVGMLALIVNPISSSRYSFGTVAFAIVVLFGAARTSARVRLTMSAALFGLFFLFPLADAFRTSTADFTRSSFFGEYAVNPDYDSIWQVANALTFWSSGAGVPGFQALGLALFWAPRSLWPGKPQDTGSMLADYNGYEFTNLSAPMWAEAAVNGGLVAVVVVFLILGFAVCRLDDRIVPALQPEFAGDNSPGGVWAIIGAVFPAYFMILLRGSLLQATGAVALIILCLLLVHRPRRPGSTSGDTLPTGQRRHVSASPRSHSGPSPRSETIG